MRFLFLDQVLEVDESHIVTRRAVTLGEEYLADHFPGFPVLPGVLMVECIVQAAQHWLGWRFGERAQGMVLGRVRALKYGRFVRPGMVLRVLATPVSVPASVGPVEFKGEASVEGLEGLAVAGKITLRPLRRLAATHAGPASGGGVLSARDRTSPVADAQPAP